MGNHQTYPKRQHRPSESVGFNKHDSDDERLVTIHQRERRISTKSAPPLEDHNVIIHPIDRTPITFSVPALPFDSHACVTGTFNDWIEHKMDKLDGKYETCIEVPQGCHYYKILVNGRSRFISSETIEYHSKFGRVHFLYVSVNDQNVNNHLERTMLSLSKLNIWTNEINTQLVPTDQPPPPRIPPHLLNVLLNRKLPAHCDPDVLPEPNSVMLRHLYALSIQNGIMILSTTIRYKQKFVTTCFYKPN
ncbi:unnamed protein product [Adineta steineri]|uniref:5'-AMP-activated protein kinase subunit beta-1 n=2 Tax=Adineta steineri TaxID=433720 RepID=A0A819BES6_9BILA|nr:unnamed protein product [Adineta steineri]CAF1196104.1 unnamed protein product [Adineta steineri]CAF1306509.1 unnamed protein product [Adineta steineri]CAF1371013.1 unnamed protein product [Adineta steineri]CAF3793144.1 unnamed protein product [Adineta steineri]